MKAVALFFTVLLLSSLNQNLTMAQEFNVQSVPEEAKRLFRQALEYNDRHEYGTALNYFLRAYQQAPEIMAEDDAGLLDNATNFLEAKANREDNNAEAHFQLAELLVLRGRNEEGLEQYRKVVEIASEGPLSALAKGEIQRIEAQLAAVASALSAQENPPGSGGPGSSNDEKELRAEVAQLRTRVQELEEELQTYRKQKTEHSTEVERARAETQKLQQEFEQFQKQASRWKTYYNIHFSNPQNYR